MTEREVWVEIPDTLKRIKEALEQEEDFSLECNICNNKGAIKFDVILRDPTKIDIMSGSAVKIRKKSFMCHDCMRNLRLDLEIMKREE